jgi:subtilisin-like proprotein convertase family protein
MDVLAGATKNSCTDKNLMDKNRHGTVHHNGRGSLDNQGGPDGFAYRYVDNQGGDSVVYNWIELRGDNSATWLNYSENADDAVLPAPIGFDFPFYGGAYSTVQVSTNGNLQFVATGGGDPDYSNECLPATELEAPTICTYWDDLDLNQGGYFPGNAVTVAYRNFGDHFIIEWDSVGLHSEDGTSLKFEAILWTNGRIKLQYNHLVIADSLRSETVGIQSRANGFALNYTCDDSLHQPINNLAVVFYQTQTGTISGHIRDSNESPLYMATATITELGVSVLSDANGYYAFPIMAPGNYTVAASRTGYTSTQMGNVAVNVGQTTTVDFSLQWLGSNIYTSVDVPKPIPDEDSVYSSLTVDASYLISDINVQLTIMHTYVSDLQLTLIGPGGQRVLLADSRGGGGENFVNTIFDDQATVPIANGNAPFTGSYIPEQSLALFNNTNVHGEWRLLAYDGSGLDVGTITAWELQVTSASAVDDPANPALATRPTLLGNYPNPFNSTTQIRYVLPRTAPVTLVLFNVLGQEVRSLVEGTYDAGEHVVMWDGRDAFGRDATSGVYLLRLESASYTAAGKVFLLR